MTRRPDGLTDDERAQLDILLGRSPALATTRELVRDFAEIMTDRRGGDLAAWMTAAEAGGEPALRCFVRGLRRDLDAVTAGMTLSHSSGAVEGHVNRIILWNLTCQGHSRLRWLTETIGSRVAVAGTPISRGVVPVGVGTSISRSRRLSRAVCPSSTAARSSSLSGIAASMRCRLSLLQQLSIARCLGGWKSQRAHAILCGHCSKNV
ncbi:transposase [Rhodococcus opacus]|uniref:transposase n=1 Tax=Rhodococcus opacus TaxID=37919 RepID=UPI0029499FC2|nr:transposase [Rhodococcus opacus]MDV6247201.1 transposase [Rhodococcus opacus]